MRELTRVEMEEESWDEIFGGLFCGDGLPCSCSCVCVYVCVRGKDEKRGWESVGVYL